MGPQNKLALCEWLDTFLTGPAAREDLRILALDIAADEWGVHVCGAKLIYDETPVG